MWYGCETNTTAYYLIVVCSTSPNMTMHEYKYGCCGINWLLCVMCCVYGRSTNTMRPGHKYEYGHGPILWLLCWLSCVQPGTNTNTAVALLLIVVSIVECPFSHRLTIWVRPRPYSLVVVLIVVCSAGHEYEYGRGLIVDCCVDCLRSPTTSHVHLHHLIVV